MYSPPPPQTDLSFRESDYISLLESNLKDEILHDESAPSMFLDYIRRYCDVVAKLILALGVKWERCNSKENTLWLFAGNAWFLLTRITFILNFTNFITDCMAYHGTISNIYIIVDLAILLQLSLLIYSLYLINKRLMQDIRILISYINLSAICNESLPIVALYLLAAVGSDLYSAVMWYSYNGKLHNKMYFTTELFTLATTTSFLTATLLFVVIDTKIVLALINSITVHFSNKTLSVTTYNRLRYQIDLIINSSKGINTARIGVAMLYVVVVIICLFNNGFFTILSVIASLKEILFITIIFFEVAKVNEQADNLTKLLGKCSLNFDPRESFAAGDAALAQAAAGGAYTPTVDFRASVWSASDDTLMTRMRIFHDLMCDPISFTLGGKRVTKLDTALHLSAVMIAMLAGILRSVVLNDI